MKTTLMPPNYRPREGDVVLVLARVRFDADKEDKHVHIQIVGEEHIRAAVAIDGLAGVFNYGWKVGDRVCNKSQHSGAGVIIALRDKMAWVKRDDGSFLTYALNELEPGPGPSTLRSFAPPPNCTWACLSRGCNCGYEQDPLAAAVLSEPPGNRS